MMTVKVVRDRFYPGEFTIYSDGDVFDIPNKSMVGTKSFYITNRGRVFAHDTGGIFTEEQVLEYDDKINVDLNSYGATLTNYNYSSFSFHVTLDFKEFLSFYKKVPKNKLHFQKSSSNIVNCLVANNFAINGTISFDQISVHKNKIIFKNNEIKEIPFFRIDNYQVEDAVLKIFGVFDVADKNMLKVEIFIPYEDVLKNIINKINTSLKIFYLVGQTNEIYPTKLRGYINDKHKNDKNVTIAFNQNKIFIIDEIEKRILKEFIIEEHQFFYSSSDRKLLIKSSSENIPVYILTIWRNDLENVIKNKLTNETHKFIPSFGKINGTLFNRYYKNQEILLAFDQNSLYVIMDNDLKPLEPISFNKGKFLFDDSKVFLIYKEEISLFNSKKTNELRKHIPKQSVADKLEQQISFTDTNEPFFFIQTPENIILKQSLEKVAFSFKNSDITDISISKYGTEKSSFSEVEIKLNNQKTFKINLFNDYIKDLIYNTYYFTKSSNLPQVSSEQLFLSYSRQVNDYILYHYFGQLVALYEGLKEITRTEEDNDIKNWKIVNYLYHTIQAQKKHFDTVSIYLPSMLEQHESSILTQHGQNSAYQPYKNLQRALMNITGQINRSLNEIESSLSAVSFAIIPRKEYDELINKRAKRGFLTAAGMGIVGALFFPSVLIGAALIGLNSYFSKKDAQEQEKIRKENENYRLDFYVAKILDSFNHFIETLLPFYISEVNQAIFQTFQQLYFQYQPILGSNEVRENLFQKITQLYTFKQLPIDESVTMKKGELVELTNKSLEFANQHLNYFRLEVESLVPKSIEAPRVGQK
jgi:hypothetical protein